MSYYKSRQIYYKLQQNIITNCGRFITNYDSVLLQITIALLQITANVITNYGSFIKLLQITAAFGVITNYGKYYKLRHYYKLRRNSGERMIPLHCLQYFWSNIKKDPNIVI